MKKSMQSMLLAFVVVMVLLSGCAPASAPNPPAPISPASTSTPLPVVIISPLPIPMETSTEVTTPSPIPTRPSALTESPACTGAAGKWGTQPNANTLSIMFTIQDCRITVVYIIGYLNGQFVTVSNETNQPINGTQFNLPYKFTDEDRYNLSGTFTSPTSASVKLVIFKGFRFTAGQPSPLMDDLIINAIANP